MKNKKRVSVAYAAWEADKEAAMLNEQSKQGWQLEKASIFGSKLVRDDSVRYVYQIDRKSEPDERYFETFAEQGWEYVTKLNGWQYFRKKYDPSLPEEEYKIYTDEQTYADSLRGDIRLNIIFGIVYTLFTLLYGLGALRTSDIMYLIFTAVFGVFAVIFFVMAGQLKRKIKGKNTAISGKAVQSVLWAGLFAVTAAVIVGPWGIGACGNSGAYLETRMTWDGISDGPVTHVIKFEINKAGYYDLDLDFHCENGTISVVIEDSEGNEFYALDGTDEYKTEDYDVRFLEGKYTAQVKCEGDCENAEFFIYISRPWK